MRLSLLILASAQVCSSSANAANCLNYPPNYQAQCGAGCIGVPPGSLVSLAIVRPDGTNLNRVQIPQWTSRVMPPSEPRHAVSAVLTA